MIGLKVGIFWQESHRSATVHLNASYQEPTCYLCVPGLVMLTSGTGDVNFRHLGWEVLARFLCGEVTIFRLVISK